MLKKKQKATLDGYISKTRTNSESRLKFSESSPNFPQNSAFFLRALPTLVHGMGFQLF